MVKKRQGENVFSLHIGRIYKHGDVVFMRDDKGNRYPVDSLCFLNKYFNPKEGNIEYPRVWEDKTTEIKAATGSTAAKEGDIVLFAFLQGRSNHPVVLGSISQMNLFGESYRDELEKFLDMQEKKYLIKENIKRKIETKESDDGAREATITTYEDIENEGDPQEERGTVKLQCDKAGNLLLDIEEIAEKTGAGNITVNLKGNNGQSNGNINLNFNGKFALVNTDDEGSPNGNKIEIDNTEDDEKINIEDSHGNKYNSSKDGIVITDTNGNTYTNNAEGITIVDAKGNQYINNNNGIIIEDANGNKYTNDNKGVKIEVAGDAEINANNNALIQAKDIKIGSDGARQAVCLAGLIDWLLTHKHLGNMGAPTPLFPADLATLQTKYSTPGGGVVSNKPNETVEVSG